MNSNRFLIIIIFLPLLLSSIFPYNGIPYKIIKADDNSQKKEDFIKLKILFKDKFYFRSFNTVNSDVTNKKVNGQVFYINSLYLLDLNIKKSKSKAVKYFYKSQSTVAGFCYSGSLGSLADIISYQILPYVIYKTQVFSKYTE